MKQKHWYHYLWIWSILYFSLGFVNILFAWLGLISFCLPLLFAIVGGNKLFCNRYCDRGQLLRFLGSQLGFSKRHDMPAWMYGKAFRSLQEFVTLFWTFQLPWHWAYSGNVAPATAQFAFGLYSLMLTSEIIALAAMLYYRPRAWCAFCPMGTLTQGICQIKCKSEFNTILSTNRH